MKAFLLFGVATALCALGTAFAAGPPVTQSVDTTKINATSSVSAIQQELGRPDLTTGDQAYLFKLLYDKNPTQENLNEYLFYSKGSQSSPSNPSPQSTPGAAPAIAVSKICQASDPATLRNCVNLVNSGQVNEIQINGQITCGAGDDCSSAFNGISRPIKIIGVGSSSGIVRNDHFNAPIFTVMNSTGPFSIRNLTLSEGPKNIGSGPAGTPFRTNSGCGASACPYMDTIKLYNTQNVLIDNLKFLEAKDAGIHMFASHHVTIRGCLFEHAWRFGVWAEYNPAVIDAQNTGIHLENNTFNNIRSNAVVFSVGKPEPSDPLPYNTITGNSFYHDHNTSYYYTADGKPYGGGMIDVEQSASWVWVEHNSINHGIIDEDPSISSIAWVYGIEIAPSHVSMVTVIHNSIGDLTGHPVRLDPSSDGTVSGVDISNNDAGMNTVAPFVDNASQAHYAGQNCYLGTSGCAFQAPTGTMSLSQSAPCTPGSAGQCSANMTWALGNTTQDLRLVKNSTSLFSHGSWTGGSAAVSKAPSQEDRYDLYCNLTLVYVQYY